MGPGLTARKRCYLKRPLSAAICRLDKKVKFVEKINAVQETDNLDDMEFHDTVGFQSSSILNGSHSRPIKEPIKS